MSDWNNKIIAEFRANGGKVGGPFEGATLLLLHHVGARSGTRRVAPLAYFPDGDRMLIIASDHNQGVFVKADLDRDYDMDRLVASVQKFVAVEVD